MYHIELISYLVEKDNYEKGCIGEMMDKTFDLTFSAPTKEETLNKAAEFFGVDSLEYDEHNKSYRSGRMENNEGYEPTESELNKFKAGKLDLWYALFEYQLYRMELVIE